jgi:hypothetical protein
VSRRTDKLKDELIQRYKLLRAVRVCYYNLLGVDVSLFGQEFFFVAGDIMEGKPIDYTQLRYLRREAVEMYLKEDR